MAAGFKQATVNATDVPATQTDFPSYVALARLGITTLAEAQSVRVYADSAKTIEWAREIVSVTEMHVKVPSLTSTVEIFVDFDGVRADYAVSATYGRNAVWTGYKAVYHMEESSGNLTDATGNGHTANVNGTPTYGITAKFGKGVRFSASTQYFELATVTSVSNGAYTISSWAKPDTTAVNGDPNLYSAVRTAGTHTDGFIQYQPGRDGTAGKAFYRQSQAAENRVEGTSDMRGIWNHMVAVRESTTAARLLINGSVEDNTPLGNSASWTSATERIGQFASSNLNQPYDGDAAELRLSTVAQTNNWISTEHNNQNAESTFWGTWTDAGGGGGGAAQTARRGVVMMM